MFLVLAARALALFSSCQLFRVPRTRPAALRSVFVYGSIERPISFSYGRSNSCLLNLLNGVCSVSNVRNRNHILVLLSEISRAFLPSSRFGRTLPVLLAFDVYPIALSKKICRVRCSFFFHVYRKKMCICWLLI